MPVTLPSDALSGVTFEGGVVAVMRDGTRLVSDIYRPAAGGPWPVLLMRQPYGRDIASSVVYAHPSWFARQGFLVVVQDVRGRGDSEGEFRPFVHEEEDGFDTVSWAAGLPGSNGRVGMYGFSYQGATQLLAALGRPPALRAIAPHMTAFDLYSGWFYRDGLLQLSTTVCWALQMVRGDVHRLGSPAAAALDEAWMSPGRVVRAMPLREAHPLANPDVPSYAIEWIRHSAPDCFWGRQNLLNRVDALGLPMFHLSGWYDLYLRGSVDGYRAMAAMHPHQFLLASPWIHIPWGRWVGGQDFGPEAVPDVDRLLATWFHYWLDHETPRGAPPFSGCRYFSLGENTWREAPSWPPPGCLQAWYLAGGGKANGSGGDGVLDPRAPWGEDDLFNYDPDVPVTAPGGDLGGLATFGPHDLAPQQQALNLLVYTSQPLAAPLRVAGDPVCELHVHSSAEETSFVVRLSRVQPNGRAEFLSLGACRVRASSGAVCRVSLDPVAVRFDVGDRVRVDVASSAYPLLIRHPNTVLDPASVPGPAAWRRALQVVRHDAAHPSRLLLPVAA